MKVQVTDAMRKEEEKKVKAQTYVTN